jgi:hypothetical protein
MSNTRNITNADKVLRVQAIRVTIHNVKTSRLKRLFGWLVQPMSMCFSVELDMRSRNHASIFLLTSDERSIRLNMTKMSREDVIGTFVVQHCSYRSSNNSLRNVDILAEDLTVEKVLQLVHEKGRDRYLLSRCGLGCRFWV